VIWYLILGFVQDAAYLSLQLTSSSEKLAELFTPRSRRHAEAKLAATSSGDDKQSDMLVTPYQHVVKAAGCLQKLLQMPLQKLLQMQQLSLLEVTTGLHVLR
jgi:hypothetical protein